MDHGLPRSRGGKNAWENQVWAGKDENARKGNRLPQEAGLKLFNVPRAPKELPASATIRKAHDIPEWKLRLLAANSQRQRPDNEPRRLPITPNARQVGGKLLQWIFSRGFDKTGRGRLGAEIPD